MGGEPKIDIVTRLESLLDEARSGKISAFAYCTYGSHKFGECVSTGWVDGAHGIHLSDAIRVLDCRYLKFRHPGLETVSGDDRSF
jgi:hypothetical protein